MHMKKSAFIFPLLAVLASSCSTTRVLAPGEYRLVRNEIVVGNGKDFNTSEIQPYIKQKADTWNPMIYVYNWSGKKGESGMSKILRKIGKAPVVYDADMLNASAENIGKKLEHLGYYGSTVDTDVTVRGKKVRATYRISLGKRYPIQSVSYVLPERGDIAADFLTDTANVTIRKGDWLSEASLEAESARSAAYLRRLGHYGFSKNYYYFEADTTSIPDSAILRMQIREYTRNETPNEAVVLSRNHFGNVNVYYPESFRIHDKVIRNLNTIFPGDPYSEETVNRTYSRLSSLRSLSSVNIELSQADSSAVDCDIRLTPARRNGFKVGIEASTNSSGLFGISPELTFYDRNLFHGGELLNVGFMGKFQFKPGKDNVHSNELGVSAGISLPRFVGLPYSLFKGPVPHTDIKASYNYQSRPEYTRNIISTSYGYSGYSGNLNYQFYPLQMSIVKIDNMDESFYSKLQNNPFMLNAYRNHFDLGTFVQLYYNTDNGVNPKSSYSFAMLNFALAGNVLSAFKGLMTKDANGAGMLWNTPFSQYVRGEFSLGHTWKFGRNDDFGIATRLLAGAGYAYGNSSVLPFEQHFYSGGASSLRGWQARSVGPGRVKQESTFVIPNQTGDMKLEANLEFRFPAFWKLYGALFMDAGNIWTLQSDSNDSLYDLGRIKADTFLSSLAANWGLGLRLDLNVILVRIDAGFQIHDPANDEGDRWIGPSGWFRRDNYAVHFGVGYPF